MTTPPMFTSTGATTTGQPPDWTTHYCSLCWRAYAVVTNPSAPTHRTSTRAATIPAMTTQPPPSNGDEQPEPEPRDAGWPPPPTPIPRYSEPAYGPPPTPQPSVYVNTPPPAATNGVATAAGVCGIVGAAISWVPLVNVFSLVLCIIAVALGGVGLARANRYAKEGRPPTGKGMAITGIVIGCVGVAVALAFIVALGSALNDVSHTTNT